MTPLKIFPLEGGGRIGLRSRLNRVEIPSLILEKNILFPVFFLLSVLIV
jgi:hypothetical protein